MAHPEGVSMLLITNQLFHALGVKTTTYPISAFHCISSNFIVFHVSGWAKGGHHGVRCRL